MSHRIDAQRIADGKAARTAISTAITRLQTIEAGYATMTAAQKNAAVKDMATYLRHIIKLVT